MNYQKHQDTQRKHYIDKDVYTAAKERIHDAINQSDNQVVLCSGGKDSVLLSHLVSECYHEQNINKPVNLIFMDEELINQKVINGIHDLEENPLFKVYWLNIPITCDMYNNGTTREYIQNDPNRKTRVRTPPDYALTLEDFGLPRDKILNRYQLADLQASLFNGKVCIFKGIRTEESLFRLTQVLRRPNSPHIGKQTPKHFECIPIYDWTTRDVFLYYKRNNLQYNPIYNDQLYADAPLRVSTPTHTYNRKTYQKLRSIDPELYTRITHAFPDMAHADRYNLTQNKHDFTDKYPHTIHGLMQYVEDCYPEKSEQITAKKKLLWAYKKREQNKKRPGSDKFGGYPLYYLFGIVQRGATMRNIVPREKPSQKCYTFEGLTTQDYLDDKNHRGEYNCNQ